MARGTPTAAGPGRRVSLWLSGVLVLAVLAAGTLYLARGTLFGSPASGPAAVRPPATTGACAAAASSPCTATPADVAVAGPPVVVTVPPHPPGPSPSPSAHPGSSSRPAATASATASARPSAPATSPASSSPPAAQGGTAAAQVLALINQARGAAGLPALTITAGLETSSSEHNLRMADGCGLSHQCPGEAPIGDRETAAGVHWTAAGENIGEGGPVADASAAIAQMAAGLTQSMLDEKPPDDGHRLNILSSTFTHIGIAVYRTSSGTVWLTQDFSN